MDRRARVDRLFQEHARALYLRGFRLPEDETYDLVQDAFLRLLEADVERVRLPRAWLFTTGRNLAINKLKRNRAASDPADVEGLADESPGPLADMEDVRDRQALWQAFQKLSAPERELLELSLEHEFTCGQMAAILGRSEISVRVAMHRVRTRLKKLLQDFEGAKAVA